MNLNIDQILEHVAPWDFTVTVGGVCYPTCRPSIAGLGAATAIAGKDLSKAVELINSFFAAPPPIRWDLPTVTAFVAGYVEYFERHTAQKKESAETAATLATAAVRGHWAKPSSGS